MRRTREGVSVSGRGCPKRSWEKIPSHPMIGEKTEQQGRRKEKHGPAGKGERTTQLRKKKRSTLLLTQIAMRGKKTSMSFGGRAKKEMGRNRLEGKKGEGTT